MQSPIQITFRHMDPSPALEQRVRHRAAELEQFYDRIVSCHVVVECQHKHHQQGRIFEVHVTLNIPGREIVVGRAAGMNHAHEDAHVAVRDAFDALRRQLEEHTRETRSAAQRPVRQNPET